MASYEYLPLNNAQKEVRLLKLLPGGEDDLLECTLKHVNLQGAPSPFFCGLLFPTLFRRPKMSDYETISYCWGDATLRSKCRLSGRLTTIPASTAAALRRFRLRDESRVLWIDAVCIDQTNLSERAQQVSLMRDVYGGCSANLIYLGESDEYTESALSSIRAIVREAEASTHGLRDMGTILYNDDNRKKYSKIGLKASIDIKGLASFFSLPWFSRVWVFQEAVLPPRSTCLCGHYKVPLMDILIASAWLDYTQINFDRELFRQGFLDDGTMFHFAHPQGMYRGRSSDRAHRRRFVIADLARGLGSTDHRDKIFGLLGITQRYFSADGNIPPLLYPSYTKHPDAVFRDATAWMLEGTLEVLTRICHDSDSEMKKQLASWTAPMDRPKLKFSDPGILRPIFSAAPALRTPGQILANNASLKREGVLLFHGFQIDLIENVTPTLVPDLKDRLAHVGPWIDSVFETLDTISSSAHFNRQGIGSVLMAGTRADLAPTTDDDLGSCIRMLEKIRKLRHYPCPISELPDSASDEDRADSETFQALLNVCPHRRVMTTAQGYAGLGPKISKAGDIIVVVYGSQWPFVMRPCKEKYYFIGHCYIYGVMDGDFFSEQTSKGVPVNTFKLQ